MEPGSLIPLPPGTECAACHAPAMRPDIVFFGEMPYEMERIEEALAQAIAPQVGVDAGKARRAAELAKNDLQSRMVGEFPELQGIATSWKHSDPEHTAIQILADKTLPYESVVQAMAQLQAAEVRVALGVKSSSN